MRLKKSQKTKLLEWISEGLQSDEINDRAASYDDPFEVSKQLVDYYRGTRKEELDLLRRTAEYDALTTGLALKSERVKKLKQLAALMERDIFGGSLWTDQVKAIRSGPFSKEVEYEEFNTAEVQQLRGVYDDIAKEVGDRKSGLEVTGKNGGPLDMKFTSALDKVYAPNESTTEPTD